MAEERKRQILGDRMKMLSRWIVPLVLPVVLSILLPVLRGPSGAWGDDEPTRCPDSIDVSEKLANAEPGWTEGHSAYPHRLAGVTIFEGPPQEQVSLVGTERKLSKQQTLVLWSFEEPSEYWLSCSYADTGVILSRAIPKTVRSCSVTYSRNVRVAGLPEIQRFDCK